MSYNLSENAFKQVEPILLELIDLKNGDVWKQSFTDNNKAARLIRQGFEYCVKNKEKVGERLANLKHNIRVRSNNDYVLAERKFTVLTPIEGVVVREKTFEGLSTFNEVVTAFLANKNLTTLYFPYYIFYDDQELNRIGKICEANNFYAVYINDRGLIIARKEPNETNTKEEHRD